ncbi:MAG: cytochrome c3 family protein [Bacteroidota bacterium]
MTPRHRALTGLAAGAALLALVWADPRMPPSRTDRPADPDRPRLIKFSHRLHVQDGGAECGTCHGAAAASTSARDNLLSPKAACAACHDVENPEGCTACHEEGVLEPLRPVETNLIFPHASHVEAGMECGACHGGIETAEATGTGHLPSMETCAACHNDREQSNACELCHTDFTTLIPPDHKAADFLRTHADASRIGGLEAECSLCHTGGFCQECHLHPELKGFGGRDLQGDGGVRRIPQDGPDRTALENVHSLDYRFTHGTDARARLSDCRACHSVREFCAACHAAGGNVTEQMFRPPSHDAPGYATLGAGSGGGLHAEEARRDIESCVTCHDVEGRDPVCLTCHDETGSVR